MRALLITLVLAFAAILVAVVLIQIGLILTGKPHFRIGRCGRLPKEKGSCKKEESSCPLCDHSKEESPYDPVSKEQPKDDSGPIC